MEAIRQASVILLPLMRDAVLLGYGNATQDILLMWCGIANGADDVSFLLYGLQ